MTKSEVAKIVALLHANAPQHPVTEATVEAWYLAMDDVPYPAAQMAVRYWIKNHKWFPFPSEIRGVIAEQLCGLPPTDEAWRMVLARMRSTYPGHPVETWTAPREVQDAVASMGGMRVLRMSGKPGDDEARFYEIYGAIRERRFRELNIPGLWEQIHAGEGKSLPQGRVL